MKRIGWQLLVGLALIALSSLFYLIHFLIFEDTHHILSYLITDFAFLPIEVLIVSMIIDKLLTIREKKERLEKLNMVIGVFFSDCGTKLLGDLAGYGRARGNVIAEAGKHRGGADDGIAALKGRLKDYSYDIQLDRKELAELKEFLMGKREILLRLMENPVLLEHESFTDLLLALFHLMEELHLRGGMDALPESDVVHLRGDVKRVYKALAEQWFAYMGHLKENYPFLHSLALRTNPFDRDASPVITA